MNATYDFQVADLSLVTAMLCVSAGFSIYWFHSTATSTRQFFFQTRGVGGAWVAFVVYQRLTGVVFLGLIPALAVAGLTPYTLTSLTFWDVDPVKTLAWVAPMSAIIIVMIFFATRQPASLSTYPQMRLPHWNMTLMGINSISWLLYLAAYEFLFRGVLFVICNDTFGFWPATAINVACYAITHIPKGGRETAGTFLYGLVLCIATHETGSIMVALVTHQVMAISNDYFCIRRNPEMQFTRKSVRLSTLNIE